MIAYCDYIAYLVQNGLREDSENLIGKVQPTKMDLSEEGYFNSPTKIIELTDSFGSKYKVTIEQV